MLVKRANGVRYRLVISTGSIRRGGTRQRHFDGTNFKPRKLPENAQTPTSRVLACKRNRSSERVAVGHVFGYAWFVQ